MSGARKATGSEVSVVFRNIPTSLSTGDLREDFIQSNTSRFAGQDAESLRHNIVRVERLKRRYKQGRNAGQWVDSSSVRFVFSQTLGKTVLQGGGGRSSITTYMMPILLFRSDAAVPDVEFWGMSQRFVETRPTAVTVEHKILTNLGTVLTQVTLGSCNQLIFGIL